MVQATATERKLQKIISARLRCAPDEVPMDKALLEELDLDSFDLVEVVLEIEHTFEPATISDKSTQELRTVRDIAAHIDAQLD